LFSFRLIQKIYKFLELKRFTLFKTIALEHFPKSVMRFLDKKCDENKKIERLTEPSEVKIALAAFAIPSRPQKQ